MNITIQLVDFATPAYDLTVRLRDKILKKPLNIEFEKADFNKEHLDYHLAAFNQTNQLVGCLVLTPLSNSTIKMRQVAVDDEHQKKGIGKALVEASEKLSTDMGFRTIELNARDTAIPFYTKLNYIKTGKPFSEVGIKHFKMEKKLAND